MSLDLIRSSHNYASHVAVAVLKHSWHFKVYTQQVQSVGSVFTEEADQPSYLKQAKDAQHTSMLMCSCTLSIACMTCYIANLASFFSLDLLYRVYCFSMRNPAGDAACSAHAVSCGFASPDVWFLSSTLCEQLRKHLKSM